MCGHRRNAYSLVEVMAVLVLIVIIGAVAVPTLGGFFGNTRQRAAVDTVKARIADARGRALRDGIPYRLAISQDKTKIRVAPDGPDFDSMAAEPTSTPQSKVTEDSLDKVTAEVPHDSSSHPTNTFSASWVTVATFLPDGTCREDHAVVEIREGTHAPIQIQLRGLTGATKTTSGGSGP